MKEFVASACVIPGTVYPVPGRIPGNITARTKYKQSVDSLLCLDLV